MVEARRRKLPGKGKRVGSREGEGGTHSCCMLMCCAATRMDMHATFVVRAVHEFREYLLHNN